MNLLLTASAVFTFIALFFVFSMTRHIRRRRPVRATGSLAGGLVATVLGGASILLAFSYYGYGRLVDEQVVGKIEFSQSAPGEFTARLMIDGEPDRLLELRGDEWQIDARVVLWKPPVTLLGLDPIYQLDRLSGRYSDIDDEMKEQRTVYALTEELTLDVWRVARQFPRLVPGVDAYYGTATYVPMADGARFEVTLSRDALIARPVNEAARKAVGDWGQ
ncbi:MAG: cation/multidrug efflux pump [Gammaproteobacteria bacterium]|nr:cation/multidrug efflux pump [Pseudomonadota bacterium]MCH8944850.1 cation/multidrug efflux pump [Pseudomonadota bacterium]TDJ40824.1 MAG: cation/multidrug efflux pump [Gammaproteobacteria bacterium]